MHSHILQLIASTIWKIVNAIKIILPVIFHPESLEESWCDAASGVDLIASDRHWRRGFLHALVGVVDKTLIWPSDSTWMNLWLVVQTDRGLEIAGPMNFLPHVSLCFRSHRQQFLNYVSKAYRRITSRYETIFVTVTINKLRNPRSGDCTRWQGTHPSEWD